MMQFPAQISHSFFGLRDAKISACPDAVNPNLYATDPTGFNFLNKCYNQSIVHALFQIDYLKLSYFLFAFRKTMDFFHH